MRAIALSAGCGALALLSLVTPTAGADPDQPPADVTYLIGKCWDPSDPVVERPTEVTYNCD